MSITDKIKQLPDGESVYFPRNGKFAYTELTTDDLKALVSELEEKDRLLKVVNEEWLPVHDKQGETLEKLSNELETTKRALESADDALCRYTAKIELEDCSSIQYSDGTWWLFDRSGDGVLSGDSIIEVITKHDIAQAALKSE